MFAKIRERLKRRKLAKQAKELGFPMTEKEYWYCGMLVLYKEELRKAGVTELPEFPLDGRFMFDHFKCALFNQDDSALIDGLIPAIRNGKSIGLYKVAKERRPGGWYDGAPWDNGFTLDLELVRILEENQDD
jgi:hypothetical protein